MLALLKKKFTKNYMFKFSTNMKNFSHSWKKYYSFSPASFIIYIHKRIQKSLYTCIGIKQDDTKVVIFFYLSFNHLSSRYSRSLSLCCIRSSMVRAYVCSRLRSVSRAGEWIRLWYTSENTCCSVTLSGLA